MFTRTRLLTTASRFVCAQTRLASSCAEGTPLNLKVKKGGKEPVALKDEEYPSWLWDLLDSQKQQEELAKDPIALRRKQMRKNNIKKIKLNNFLENS